jgi:transcriptional regulator with XRE-family HTH domain
MANDVSLRLKAVRQQHGLSQRELAKRAGVTNGMISLIEQGRVSPSVASLKKVLDGIPMGLADFFTMDPAGTLPVFYSAVDLVELGEGPVSLRLVAAQRAGRRMALLHEVYEPGADTGSEMLSHAGEEGGVVVAGRIEVTIAGQTRVLGPGDAYYFSSSMPHRFRNRGRERCEIISASSPPTL